MHSDTSPQRAAEPPAFNFVHAGPFKRGAVPAPLGTMFETRNSSDESASDRLCEAIHEMFHALNSLLNEELDSAQACLLRAAAALRLPHPASQLPDAPPTKTSTMIRRGLAPWQARLVKAHIEAHLDVSIRNKDLADLVALSAFHFSRVFRVSFGQSPHHYVTRRRVERAQGLMLTTRLPLSQIAIDCGFADQAHFTKLFRRFAGETPSEWRRMRAQPICGRLPWPRAHQVAALQGDFLGDQPPML